MNQQTSHSEQPVAEQPVAEQPGTGRPSDRVEDTLPQTEAADSPDTRATVEDIEEALKDVIDPELGVNVVDLGLVYGLNLEGDDGVVIDMTLTSAACPLTDVLEEQVATVLEGLVERAVLNWVWMPPWTPAKITEDGREQLRALGFNVG